MELSMKLEKKNNSNKLKVYRLLIYVQVLFLQCLKALLLFRKLEANATSRQLYPLILINKRAVV